MFGSFPGSNVRNSWRWWLRMRQGRGNVRSHTTQGNWMSAWKDNRGIMQKSASREKKTFCKYADIAGEGNCVTSFNWFRNDSRIIRIFVTGMNFIEHFCLKARPGFPPVLYSRSYHLSYRKPTYQQTTSEGLFLLHRAHSFSSCYLVELINGECGHLSLMIFLHSHGGLWHVEVKSCRCFI